MAAADYNNKVQAYFVAFLGRPATSSELAQYSEALNANTGSVWTSGLNAYLAGLAGLGTTAPTVAEAGALVTSMFQNITGTATMDMTNYNFYVGQLLSGSIKPRGLANAMLNDFGLMPRNDGTYTRPDNWVTTKTVTAEEKAALEAKVDFAGDFTAALDTPAEDQALGASPAAAKALLATVTSAATAATAASSIASTIAATVDAANTVAGQAFTLTSDVNVLTGTAGADTFSGGVGTIDSDNLNGGAGNDSLSVTLSNADDNNAAFTSTSIESVTMRTTGAVTLDMGDVTGVATLTASRLAGALTLNDVQDLADIVIDRNTANANLDVNYVADLVAGDADEVTVTITNSSDAGTIDLDGIETVNLISSNNPLDGTNELTITGDADSTLNISGAGDLEVVATDAGTINNSASADVVLTATAATEINHSGSGELDVTVGAAVDTAVSAASATGALVLTANGAGDLDITGSGQADTIDMLSTLATGDVIDGGDGSDVLIITGDNVTSADDGDIEVTNVETLEIESDTNADDLDFDVFSAAETFETVRVTSTANADQVTLTDVQSASYVVRNATTGNAASDLAAFTIDLKDSSGTADAVSITLQNRQLGTTNNQNDFVIAALTAAGVENLTINTARTSTAGTAEDITVTALTAGDVEVLTLTGNADLVISNALSTTVETIDASAFTGALDITLGASITTVTGGTGADTIRFGTTLTAADSVDGGAGSDVVLATLSAGTLAPVLTGVETLGITFSGGALSAANLDGVTTLRVVDATTAAVASNLTAEVATINQRGGGSAAINFNYVADADATVTYTVTSATENVANSATTFTNVTALTVAGGDGTTTDRTLALGALTGSALTSLSVTSGDDTGDTVNTGNITAANLASLTVTADEANITLGTVGAAALATLSVNSSGAGDITVGAITAGSKVTSVSIVSTVDGSIDFDDITATDSDIDTFDINLDGTYGASDVDTIVADNIATLTITTTSDGTSLDIEAFNIDESIGSISFNTGDDFTIGAAAAAFDTGAKGTIGDITIRATDTFTAAADGVFINDALTVGNISITASGSGTGVNLGNIDEATTVGNITIVANDDVEFDGADAATTVGNIDVTVASGKTVDMNDGVTGTTGGTVGTITARGAGDFTLEIGAVTSLGTIDLSGLTGDSTITLSNTTAIGVIFTGGEGDDTFTGTGGGDVISTGLGADIVTGGSGADTIDLSEDEASVDTVVFSTAATNGSDSINGFTFGAGGDLIDVELLGNGDIDAEVAVAAGGTVADAADVGTVYVFADGATASNGETIADYTDLTDVLAFLNAALTIEAADVDCVAVINDLVNDKVYIYNLDIDATADTDIESISLVGVITAENADTAFTTANTGFTA